MSQEYTGCGSKGITIVIPCKQCLLFCYNYVIIITFRLEINLTKSKEIRGILSFYKVYPFYITSVTSIYQPWDYVLTFTKFDWEKNLYTNDLTVRELLKGGHYGIRRRQETKQRELWQSSNESDWVGPRSTTLGERRRLDWSVRFVYHYRS